MPPELSKTDIATIKERILNHDGKPTWKNVVAIAQAVTGHPYSRMTLSGKPDIKDAYDFKIHGEPAPAQKKGERPKSLALQMTEERLENLKRKLELANSVNAKLMEQFVTWSYNAHLRGLTKADLDRPLPVVDRNASRGPLVAERSRRGSAK